LGEFIRAITIQVMKLSIVIPFYDEERNVVPVLGEIRRCHPEAEIIAIDDHSSDRTFELLSTQPGIRAWRLPRHLGQSAALHVGLRQATGDVCVIMDGDGQSNAAEIKALLAHLPEHDLVVGRRVSRSDSRAKIAASWLANRIRRWVLGDGLMDAGGTPKIMKRECVAHLPAFDGMHRFIPSLLTRAGFSVVEVPVSHHPRLHGCSKYTNAGRASKGLWDLIGVKWLGHRLIDPRLLEPRSETRDDQESAGSRGP
jgi:dolichol-phosphate mannosyltransferase